MTHLAVHHEGTGNLINKLLGIAVTFSVVAFFWPRLVWMCRLWLSDGLYSFSFVVPLISAGIIFLKRPSLERVATNPCNAGLLVVLVAVFLTILLDWSGLRLYSLTPLLIASSMAGILWAVWGAEVLRALAFPIGFLLFLVPVPPPFIRTIDYPLQELCARVTSAFAQLGGIDARQVGATVYLPNFTMGVAPACNGLRSSVAMLSLAVVYAHLVRGALARKLLLVALAIPLAYLANFIRLFCDVFVVNALGPRFLPYEGAYDYAWGFLIFMLAVVFLFGLARVLRCDKFREIS